jgi:hypothetical protein
MKKDTHKAIFKGQIRRKVYYFNPYFIGNMRKGYDVLDYKTIEEVELNEPTLEQNQSIHLASKDKVVNVGKVVRSTDNSIIYLTDYVFETIEDEETDKSKEIAEKELEDHKRKLETEEKQNDKKWWKLW